MGSWNFAIKTQSPALFKQVVLALFISRKRGGAKQSTQVVMPLQPRSPAVSTISIVPTGAFNSTQPLQDSLSEDITTNAVAVMQCGQRAGIQILVR